MIHKINFLYETKKWSIYDDGYNLKKNIDKIILSRIPIIIPIFIKIIHFGSINLLFKYRYVLPIIKFFKIKIVCSWFHIDDSGRNFENYYYIYKYVDLWHATNQDLKKHLLRYGINNKKIQIINLGYEKDIFFENNSIEVQNFKKNYNIPKALIFGSFVKDSPGFGNSEKPKSIKRPQLLISILRKVKNKKKIFVILTGPSRGYVIKNLKKYKIDYLYLGNIPKKKLALAMNIIDINIISSLREGGPKSVIESTACGKFILSTDVGIVSNILSKYNNGLIYNNENDFDLDKFLSTFKLFKGLKNVSNFIKNYCWENISKEYKKKLYSKNI